MEKNNDSSKSCVCKRITLAIARSPTMKFFRHGSFSHQDASPDKTAGTYSHPSAKPHAAAAAKTDMIQRKSHSRHHVKVSDYKDRQDGLVPIQFDYTNVTSNGNGKFHNPGTVADNVNNGQMYTNMFQPGRTNTANGHGQVVKVPSQVKPEPPNVQAPRHQTKASTGQYNGQHGSAGYKKQGSDINDMFSDYIRRARMTIRTFSNAGDDQRNGSASPTDVEAEHTKKMENTKDHFSDFIHRTRMRIRTPSKLGQGNANNSFKRE